MGFFGFTLQIKSLGGLPPGRVLKKKSLTLFFFCFFFKKKPVDPTEELLNVSGARSLAMTPDDKFIAVATYGSKLFIFNVETGQKIHECEPHSSGAIRKLEFNKSKFFYECFFFFFMKPLLARFTHFL